ncbi:MAG: c-type cytochrome biogenesis protein CcmI, partial [Caulobacteraceae bacterium]
MIWLWIAAALVSAGLAALIVQRAARKAMAVRAESPALAVYRRQMAELDALADLGVLAESERRSVRAETGRRLLAAADRTEAPLVVGRPTPILMAAAAAPLVAVIVFMAMGPADYPDEPFAQRLAGWRAMDPSMLTPPQMAAILGDDAAKHPDDPVPLQHLAVAELASGHAAEAAQALDRALALDPRDAAVWEMRGVISTVEAGGDVKPDAARDFRRALALDPALTNA